jgi:hypothetical protein
MKSKSYLIFRKLFKDILIGLIVFSTITLVAEPAAYLVKSAFVDYCWKYVDFKSNPTNIALIILGLTSLTLCITHFYLKKSYQASWISKSILLIGCFILYYVLLGSSHWKLFGFYEGRFYYVYILLIPPVYILLLKFKSYFKSEPLCHENKSIYSIDASSPLEFQTANQNELLDEFNRSGKAIFIARQIEAIESKQSFAIGIVGRWGSGKTHFMKMVVKEIKNIPETAIIFSFTPWKNSGGNITQAFFEILENNIKGDLSYLISQYSRSFQKKTSNALDKNILGVFTSETNDALSEINEAIIKSGKKIIIVLDDIDRLDKKEIIEVLRIIRNTANFSNTIYLIAYDRDYIETAIKKINPENPSEYLEKIIQVQFYLPSPTKQALVDKFSKLSIEALKRYYKTQENEDFIFVMGELAEVIKKINSWENTNDLILLMTGSESHDSTSLDYNHDHFFDFVTNIRDVYTLSNSYIHNLLEGDKFRIIDAYDLLLIELIKMKCPKIYQNVRSKYYLTLSSNGIYTLNKVKTDTDTFRPACASIRYENVQAILDTLFSGVSKKSIRINNRNHFEWYFDSFTAILTPSEIEAIESNAGDKLKKIIAELYPHKKESITQYINEFSKTPSKEEFLRVFVIAMIVAENNETFLRSNSFATILGKLYLGEDQLESTKEYILEQLTSQSDSNPYLISIICFQIISIKQDRNFNANSFPSLEEIKAVLLNSFRKCIEAKLPFSKIQEVYRYCIDKVVENRVFIIEEANTLFRQFIETKPNDYLETFIRPYEIGNPNSPYAGDPFAIQIFKDLQNIIILIDKLPITRITIQVKHFLELYKRRNESPVKWHPHFLNYFSDKETLVATAIDSYKEFYPSVEFTHQSSNDIGERFPWTKQYPKNFIAHTEMKNLTPEEPIEGGKYLFKKIIRIEEPKLFQKVVIKAVADDFVKIKINETWLTEKEVPFFNKEFTMDLFNPGINEIYFEVRNASAAELPQTNATFETNPYGLIYEIELFFLQSKEDKNKSTSP